MIPGQTRQSAAVARSANLPHVVYRCYDADDRLLYVGCTLNASRRLSQHQHAKPGAQLASRVLSMCMTRFEVTDAYPSRDIAKGVEALAIATEQPVLNFHSSNEVIREKTAQIAEYLEGRGIPISSVDLKRCAHCNILRPYRATEKWCSDCQDPEFRDYITARREGSA